MKKNLIDSKSNYRIVNKSITYPTRVNFCFLSNCNMKCNYCFNRFNKIDINEKQVLKIFNEVSSWGIDSITISGGDPLNYIFIKDCISILSNIPFIQIDTNGIKLTERDDEWMMGKIQLLGLPLDGSNVNTHRITRSEDHFHKIINHLNRLKDKNLPIKINTVVHKGNIGDLLELAKLLSDFNIALWSIYEFWKINETASCNCNIEKAESDILMDTINILQNGNIKIEYSAVKHRSNGYFFIDHTGMCYTISHVNKNEYEYLGDIYDRDTFFKWDHFAADQQIIRVNNRKNIIYRME